MLIHKKYRDNESVWQRKWEKLYKWILRGLQHRNRNRTPKMQYQESSTHTCVQVISMQIPDPNINKQRLDWYEIRKQKNNNITQNFFFRTNRWSLVVQQPKHVFCYFGVDLELDTDLKSVKRKENTNLMLYGFQFLMLAFVSLHELFVIRGMYPLMSDVAVFMFCVWTGIRFGQK